MTERRSDPPASDGPATEVRVVVTTTDSAEEAERLARALVDDRHAACVQIVGPVRSVFRWEGAVSVEAEWQVVAKTTAEQTRALVDALTAAHSYDVPEVLALPVVDGHGPYLSWVAEETRAAPTAVD